MFKQPLSTGLAVTVNEMIRMWLYLSVCFWLYWVVNLVGGGSCP